MHIKFRNNKKFTVFLTNFKIFKNKSSYKDENSDIASSLL